MVSSQCRLTPGSEMMGALVQSCSANVSQARCGVYRFQVRSVCLSEEPQAQGSYELLRSPVPLLNLILLFFPVSVSSLLSVLLSSFPPGAAEPHA